MQVADADRSTVAQGCLPPFRRVETQGVRPRHFVMGVEHSDDSRLPVALGVAGRRQPLAAQVGAGKAPLLLVRGKEQVRPGPLRGLEGVLAALRNHLVQNVFLVILKLAAGGFQHILSRHFADEGILQAAEVIALGHQKEDIVAVGTGRLPAIARAVFVQSHQVPLQGRAVAVKVFRVDHGQMHPVGVVRGIVGAAGIDGQRH